MSAVDGVCGGVDRDGRDHGDPERSGVVRGRLRGLVHDVAPPGGDGVREGSGRDPRNRSRRSPGIGSTWRRTVGVSAATVPPQFLPAGTGRGRILIPGLSCAHRVDDMSLRWRVGPVAVIAAAIVGGFMPHSVVSATESSAAAVVRVADPRCPSRGSVRMPPVARAAPRPPHPRPAWCWPSSRPVPRSPCEPPRAFGAGAGRPPCCPPARPTRSSTLPSSPSSNCVARLDRPARGLGTRLLSTRRPSAAPASNFRGVRQGAAWSTKENTMSKSTTRPSRPTRPKVSITTKTTTKAKRPSTSSPPTRNRAPAITDTRFRSPASGAHRPRSGGAGRRRSRHHGRGQGDGRLFPLRGSVLTPRGLRVVGHSRSGDHGALVERVRRAVGAGGDAGHRGKSGL